MEDIPISRLGLIAALPNDGNMLQDNVLNLASAVDA
jgi:hypothetical protein